MRILFLNTLFDGGGAEKIAKQVYQGVKEKNFCKYIVGFNTFPVEDRDVSVLYDGIIKRIFNRLITKNHSHVYRSLGYSKRKILRMARQEEVDLVHLHNAHGHYLGLRDIAKIGRKYPLLWTIHDCWIATGHCAAPFDCPEILNQCANCPHREYYPPVKRRGDIRRQYREKRLLCHNENILFATPSQWMKEQLIRDMIPEEKVRVVYNGIDMDEFRCMDKGVAREALKIPENKRIIGVIAAQLGIRQKGMGVLLDALQVLPEIDQYHLVIAGGGSEFTDMLLKQGVSCSYIGYLNGGEELSRFYSALDVLVNPSLAESFGLVNIEAMACGTPPVAFRVGPIGEIITDEVGWLASSCSSESLAETIESAFNNQAYCEKAQYCREYVQEHFSLQKMINEYQKLYAEFKQAD